MVSLFDISTQKPLWSHLSTGIPTLDSMLRLQSEAVLDMQSVPANSAFTAVMCSLIVSHLSASRASTVVVLETINAFSWHSLQTHPGFEESWVAQDRILSYSVHSFAQLYAFFAFMPLATKDPGSVLMLVTNFHEIVEFYRLQTAATHEELLLKHQIDKNRTYLENYAKISEEGFDSVDLPPVPAGGRENPTQKTQNQINGLLSMMSAFAFKQSAVIVLLGHLEPKFRPRTRKDACPNSSMDASAQSSQAPVSQTTPVPLYTRDASRLVLIPVTLGPASADKPSLAESKLTARVVFYNDWYYKSPHFQRENRAPKRHHHFFVSVAKVSNLSGSNHIYEPVYFHCKALPLSPFSGDNKSASDVWLLDLSEPEKESEHEALASLIQNSITSTQMASRVPGSDEVDAHRRKARRISIPSSPPPPPPLVDNLLAALDGQGFDVNEEDTEESASDDSNDNEMEDADDSDCDSDSDHDTEDDTGSGSEGPALEHPVGYALRESHLSAEGAEPEFRIRSDHLDSVIDGSDVESTGTLLEDMDNSEPEWLMRHC